MRGFRVCVSQSFVNQNQLGSASGPLQLDPHERFTGMIGRSRESEIDLSG